ncbi:MAG: hypothetical protein V4720_06330 [Pseudomonadota bacterium]
MTDTRCPACDAPRIGHGTASAPEYTGGAWVGCTLCGFSISGPDAEMVAAAFAACCRSTALRDLRQAPAADPVVPA